MIVLTAPLEASASPLSLSARLPPGSDAVRAVLAKLPEPGHELAEAISPTKTVLPVMLGESGRFPKPKAHFIYRGARDPFGEVPRFGAVSAPPAILESNAAGLAAANLDPDPDGMVRHMPVAVRVDRVLIPSIGAEVLRLVGGKTDITVASNEHDPLSFFSGIGIAGLQTLKGIAPTDRSGRVWLRYAANTAQRALNPNALAVQPLKGAIVVVGLEGETVKTPLGASSTASVTAEGIENLLGDVALSRPAWAPVVEALLLAALGAGLIFLLRFGLGWAAVVSLAAPALLSLISWYLYAAHSLLIDWATPALFLGLTFVTGAIVWLRQLEQTYAGLRQAFSDSLPRTALQKIARHPGLLKSEGETRKVSYLVCTLHGYTSGNDAAGFVAAAHKILDPLTEQVLRHGGTLDHLRPDGFSAFWNAPLEDEDHALHACEAANAIAAAAAEIASEAWRQGLPVLEVSVGIATGDVIAGGFGGRLSYGVQGAAVILAEEIHALCRRYGAPLVATEQTRQLAERGAAFLEIDSISDTTIPTVLYALMGNSAVRASPKVRAMSVFHDHIFQAIRNQNWRVARELIAQCRRLSGANQTLYDLHLARIAYYETHPPGTDWDGAFRQPLE
jgi:adenylate cyclase